MKEYDLIIIGAGGVGLASAMYAGRLGLKTLVLGSSHGSELPVGGVITTTRVVENYPGFLRISGLEIAKKLEEHAKSYNATILRDKVKQITKTKKGFSVNTEKEEYSSKAIVLATGTQVRKLDVPGSKEFEKKGVTYCALCDGPLYKDRVVAVVGGSDSSAKDALLLADYAKKVYMIYRGEQIHPEPINLQRIQTSKNIEVLNNTNISEIKGDKFLKSIILTKEYKGKKELEIDGLFVAIGHLPISDLAEKLGVKLNDKKEIIIDHKDSSTNVPGIFAAGDVTDKPFKQLITGVAEGCTAAYSAYEYLTKNKVQEL